MTSLSQTRPIPASSATYKHNLTSRSVPLAITQEAETDGRIAFILSLKSSGGVSSIKGGHGQDQEYVPCPVVLLPITCEEALRDGECTERDVKYCFELVDEAGMQGVILNEVATFYHRTE